MTKIHVAVVYHSGSGHTARQAGAVARGAGAVAGAEVALLDLEALDEAGWAALDRADAIVFGAPTYMGSPSAAFKGFAEATAKAWADGLRWKDKLAAGFTNSGSMSGDKLNTLVAMAVLAAQHGMHWVGLGLTPGWSSSTAGPEDLNRLGSYLGAMAQSDMDAAPDVAPPPSDLATAERLGRRVGEAARRWVLGGRLEADEAVEARAAAAG